MYRAALPLLGDDFSLLVFLHSVGVERSGSRKTLCQSHTKSHLLVYQRTAHPAVSYAGRSLGLEVIVWQDGVSQHCKRHGEAVSNQLLLKDAYSQAKKHAVKDNIVAPESCDSGRLQFIEVALTPKEASQVIRVSDPTIEEANTTWRTGQNITSGRLVSLEENMGILLERELTQYGLYMQADPTDNSMGIYTRQSIAEGAKIMDVAALVYTDIEIMNDFLSEGGNQVLSDMLLTTKEILVDEGDVSLYKANRHIHIFWKCLLGLEVI